MKKLTLDYLRQNQDWRPTNNRQTVFRLEVDNSKFIYVSCTCVDYFVVTLVQRTEGFTSHRTDFDCIETVGQLEQLVKLFTCADKSVGDHGASSFIVKTNTEDLHDLIYKNLSTPIKVSINR